MPESSGTGDPARTLHLLWWEPNRVSQRGPKQGLTVDRVVKTAIELADAEGLPAVTMRRVAEALGVAPMTLYTYVPGKAELLDLMLDRVYADTPRATLARKPWRRRVRAVAMENQDLFDRHPWAATVSTSRPPLGPGLIGKYEHELGAFAGLGLTDVEMDAALTYVLGFVQASARAAAEAQAVQRTTDLTDEQWWAAHAPILARIFDETRYPLAARVGAAAGAAHGGAYNPTHAFQFGLARVLDGLGVLIDGRDATARTAGKGRPAARRTSPTRR
jgi:AcrR family transcriptional regulator